MECISTRRGFGEALVELGERYDNIVVLGADITDSTRTSYFKKRFPDRFFSMGISEQDAAGEAAGLSIAGLIPFFCTYGVFASGRAWEQIRTTIAYSNLNVKIGGAHAGIMTGPDGATHQALEEIALMRVLPRMTLLVPCDYNETKKATVASVEDVVGPVYIRFGRPPVPVITDRSSPFKIGKANVMRKGRDISIIACGAMVYYSLLAAELLNKDGISAEVINLHTIKPIDRNAIVSTAKKTGCILTVEEHQVHGGMGSAVAEVIVKEFPVPMDIMGIDDRFGESGEPNELIEYFHLSEQDIARRAKRLLKRKR